MLQESIDRLQFFRRVCLNLLLLEQFIKTAVLDVGLNKKRHNGRVMKHSKKLICATLLFLLVSSSTVSTALFSVQPVNAQLGNASIYINTDGAVTGTDKIQRERDVYTIIGNLSGSSGNGEAFIKILKDNIVLDGAGYTLKGTGTGIAILIEGRTNVTVINVIISNFGNGIHSKHNYDVTTMTAMPSENHRFLNNTIKATYWGIALESTNNTFVAENILISLNSKYGLNILSSHHNTITNNKIVDGSISLERATENIFFKNTINSKPFVLLENVSNQVIDGAGQVLLFGCNNITIRNVNPNSDLRAAIQLFHTNNSEITASSGRIALTESHHNKIHDNELSNIGPVDQHSTEVSIKLAGSKYNEIYRNKITLQTQGEGVYLEGAHLNNVYANTVSGGSTGIKLMGATDNNVGGNNISNCTRGIELTFYIFASIPPSCIGNSIYGNIINQCDMGIYLYGADNNRLFANNITTSTEYSIYVHVADENTFYNNNIESSTLNVYEEHAFYWGMGFENYYSENNTWDLGKWVGGNFWSDYKGTDLDGDGIGDTSYIIDANNTDRYPLTKPFNITTATPQFPNQIPTSTQTPLPTVTASDSPSPAQTVPVSPSPTIPEFPQVTTLLLIVAGTAGLIIFKKRKKVHE